MVKIGELFMEGPRLGQSLECVRGQPCEQDVKGEELQAGEKLLALLSCGTGSRITGFPADGVASTAGHFSFGRQSTADGLPDVVDAQAGIYRASRKISCVGSFCQLWCATHNGCSRRSIPLLEYVARSRQMFLKVIWRSPRLVNSFVISNSWLVFIRAILL